MFFSTCCVTRGSVFCCRVGSNTVSCCFQRLALWFCLQRDLYWMSEIFHHSCPSFSTAPSIWKSFSGCSATWQHCSSLTSLWRRKELQGDIYTYERVYTKATGLCCCESVCHTYSYHFPRMCFLLKELAELPERLTICSCQISRRRYEWVYYCC